MKGRVLNSINSLQSHRVEDLFLVAHDELVESLEKSLHEGIVKFEYVKVSDNSVRQAFGTLKGELIPNKNEKVLAEHYRKIEESLDSASEFLSENDGEPAQKVLDGLTEKLANAYGSIKAVDAYFEKEQNKEQNVKSPDTVVYFDLEAQEFRSFKKENLISVYA